MFGVKSIRINGRRDYHWYKGQAFEDQASRKFVVEKIWYRDFDVFGYGISEIINEEKQKPVWIRLETFNTQVREGKYKPIKL